MSVEIIIKKVKNSLGSPSALCFGDVRTQMASDLLKNLTTVIERKADYPMPYYILVYANVDRGAVLGQRIKETIILLDRLPSTKLLGTVAFRIDNKLGDATMEWCLPLDIPAFGFASEPERATNGRVITDVAGLPVFNRGVN